MFERLKTDITLTQVVFLLLIMLMVTSCKKEEGPNTDTHFDVKIESTIGGIDEIRLIGYLEDGSRSIIGKGGPSSGGYTVSINNPLAPIYLYNIKGVPDFYEHFNFSNPDVMCYNAVYFFDAFQKNRYVGTFSYVNTVESQDKNFGKEYHWIKYIYVSDDVDITGTHMEDGVPYQTYDLRLKKGWNAYVQIDYLDTESSIKVKSLFTSTIPTGATWNLSLTSEH